MKSMWNGWRRLGAMVLAGTFAAGFGLNALAHGDRGWHRGGAAVDPAKADERIERRVKRFLERIGASEEQRAKVTVIAKQAAADLRGLRGKQRELREKARALLVAPQVDRAAVEALRVEQIKLADEASRRLSLAMADAAEVLTPEQRAKIAERMKARGERHGHRQRG